MLQKYILGSLAVYSAIFLTVSLSASELNSSKSTTNSNSSPQREKMSQLPKFASPELAIVSKYKVGVRTITVTNPGQLNINNPSEVSDRTLKLEVWYPVNDSVKGQNAGYENITRTKKPFSIVGEAFRDRQALTEGKFPLVILSHGYTGYRTMMYYLGEHLAANGYIVAAIDHTDSTNEDVDFINAGGAGFPSTLYNRSRDQQFVLNYFAGQENFLAKIVDSNNASVIGHSMGGFGAINTVGGCFNFSKETLQKLGYNEDQAIELQPLFNTCAAGGADANAVDSRWKAMIAMAPWGGELGVFNREDLSKIKVPSMIVAGSQDQVSGYEFGIKSIFDAMQGDNKFMLVYENARHNIAAHYAPKVAREDAFDYSHYSDEAWNNEVLNANNKHFTLAFLDCYVKAMSGRCEYLNLPRNSNAARDADGNLVPNWKGFSPQYSTGMEWHSPSN